MIAIKYSLFAGFATILNLLSQLVSLRIYHDFLSLYIAMFIGTIVGLIVKYILDKKYIFCYASQNKLKDAKKFSLYSLTGVLTTMIFWGTEITFNLLFNNENAKYIGGAIGLSIGYSIKYFLDKKYVFKK